MDIDDIFTMMIYDNALKIKEAGQLDNFRELLEDNFMYNCFLFNEKNLLNTALRIRFLMKP